MRRAAPQARLPRQPVPAGDPLRSGRDRSDDVLIASPACSARVLPRVDLDPAALAVAGDRSKRSTGPAQHWGCAMTALLIGYARCSTDEQDLTVQREGLAALGVTADRATSITG